MQANRINIPQGTDEWLNFRRGKISASKVPIILSLSPYQTALGLYEEETGLRERQACSPHMQKGLDIEDEVRDYFFRSRGIKMSPAVVQHPNNNIFIASLDGLSECGNYILEIKNNNETYHLMAKESKLPEHYYSQVQMQLYVTNLKFAYYLSHRQGDYALVLVDRDESFIIDMVVKLLDFKRRLDDFDPPPMTDRDYEDMSSDAELSTLAWQYKEQCRISKESEANASQIKRQMQEKIGDKSARGANWKITKVKRKGNIDYETIIHEKIPEIDLESYRKSETVSFRISVN